MSRFHCVLVVFGCVFWLYWGQEMQICTIYTRKMIGGRRIYIHIYTNFSMEVVFLHVLRKLSKSTYVLYMLVAEIETPYKPREYLPSKLHFNSLNKLLGGGGGDGPANIVRYTAN